MATSAAQAPNTQLALPDQQKSRLTRTTNTLKYLYDPTTGPQPSHLRSPAMRVLRALHREKHLNPHHQHHTNHSDKPAHRRIRLRPEARQARVRETRVRGGQEVHERRRDEDAGAEVARDK